ncbi:MAG TPA: DUF502 domain-containing protein [Ferrovibrio sp.]|jgi:uncharacterized membrane protein|uniref:DUF502 domain-containing protein n=1 Tax=Ferrovibrio sp. TaxID=1917215 RepID=UPI002B4B2059|nr:DUF502 domain-containing protein [Ferrovibrio sp.]HLT76461.1 DUF502 domain-containing protein [Ferrovibrio sp.]
MTEPNPPNESPETPAIIVPPPRLGLLTRLRNYFLAGIIVTAPIGLTIYLVVITIQAIDRNVRGLVPAGYEPERFIPYELPYGIPGLGILAALVLLTLIGFLATNLLGRTLLRISERLVSRMPIVRGIYSALKQIFETVFSQSGNSFRQVALVPWPSAGSWTIAFVTNYVQGEVSQRLGSDLVTVYVPTTPNPTGGYMTYYRRSDVIILDMTVDEAMKLIISCGVIVPPLKSLPATPPAPEAQPSGGFTP